MADRIEMADRIQRVIKTGLICRCGGEIVLRDYGGSGEWRYETSCEKCWECDPNGWGSQRRAIEEAKHYFSAQETTEEA